MIVLRDRRFIVDGRPRLVLCGEIHYFRLPRADWQDRLDKLKAAGCDTVASYIPWLCHEPVAGRIDLDGCTRPELDLGAFVDLCRDNGLGFLARPGPFVMAELKNEGLPHWLHARHPDIRPVGWDGQAAPTRGVVDYLAPDFLAAARNWYAAVLALLVPRLHSRGGNIIGLQLDNEVGMMAWLGNAPNLGEPALADFAAWLAGRYPAAVLRARYPFDLDDAEARAVGLRSPGEAYAAALLRDLGHYQRGRHARYLATLREWAEAAGVVGVPLLVNVHGTGGGRGFGLPIGISQLYEAYQGGAYLAGSDLYLGDLTPDNFQDLHLCNALLEASLAPGQVFGSLEFECGDGDYGNMSANRYDPSAVDLKTRMCVAQGNRLLNYYLFAGGRNYRMDPAPDDGDGRIAMTGECHGSAAPVKPDGGLSYTFPRMARAIRTLRAVADKLADMDEARDGVAFGFIPDYFMTETRYPGSAAMGGIIGNLEANRAYGAWESMARAMLLAGYRFGGFDLQNRPLNLDGVPVLALPSARYMDEKVQAKLVAWLDAGGGLLLFGEVPLYDMEGRECAVLAGALGVVPLGTRHSTAEYYLALRAEGWAAPRPEVRTHFAQVFEPGAAQPLLRLHGSGEVAAFDAKVGRGRAIVIATAYRCDIDLFRAALARLGARPGLVHDCPEAGLFLTSTVNPVGETFVHVLNVDGFGKSFRLYRDGRRLFGGRALHLPPREGVMLPVDMDFGEVRIRYATAEIVDVEPRAISFRSLQPQAVIVLETVRECVPSQDYTIRRRGGLTRLRVRAGVEWVEVAWR